MEPVRHKSFTAGPSREQPISFDLEGERFSARPFIVGRQYMSLLRAASSAYTAERIRAYEELLQFALDVPTQADPERTEYQRFCEFVDDPDRLIDADVIDDVCSYLFAEYGKRPTQRPSVSPTGPQQTNPGSAEASGSEAAKG